MNRFKKYIRKQGIKLESDYPWLPYGDIESVQVDSENAIIRVYYLTIGWIYTRFKQDGTKQQSDIYTDFYHDEY